MTPHTSCNKPRSTKIFVTQIFGKLHNCGRNTRLGAGVGIEQPGVYFLFKMRVNSSSTSRCSCTKRAPMAGHKLGGRLPYSKHLPLHGVLSATCRMLYSRNSLLAVEKAVCMSLDIFRHASHCSVVFAGMNSHMQPSCEPGLCVHRPTSVQPHVRVMLLNCIVCFVLHHSQNQFFYNR